MRTRQSDRAAIMYGYEGRTVRLESEGASMVEETLETGDLEGRVLVLSEEYMAEGYRTLKHRLFMATGGFGCSPTAIGNAVFGYHLSDGEYGRWERWMFERYATPEAIAEAGVPAKRHRFNSMLSDVCVECDKTQDEGDHITGL